MKVIAVLKVLMKLLFGAIGLVTIPMSWLMGLKKRKRLPPIKDHLLLLSATKLARMIREKEVKSENLIKAFVDRCKEVNPIINAVVETRYDVAIAEAKNVDSLIASNMHTPEQLEKMYPLLGIPMTVKESLAVKGMSNEAGRLRTHRNPALIDAVCISQARTAGAIPLLVSNTPEMCMCWETYNYVTGLTRNPYDTNRTPGGSSGGEAALISSGASIIGVGSDIAGSLRLPAMFTGIFGHKPTPYAVSTVGHMPHSESKDWNKYFAVGPMARYAEDLPLLLKVLRDPNGPELQLDKKVSIQDTKFYYMEGDHSGTTRKINSEIKVALQKLIKYFSDTYQIKVTEAKMHNIKSAFEISTIGLLKLDGVETIFSEPGNPSKWKSVSVEVAKKAFGCSKSTFPAIAYGLLKKGGDKLSDKTFAKAAQINAALRKEFIDLLKDNGVCFYPSYYRTAGLHYDYYRNVPNFAYTMMFNSLGLPVTNCPLGLTSEGMPVGIQIVCSPGYDHLSFAVAKELETAFGGWVSPPHS